MKERIKGDNVLWLAISTRRTIPAVSGDVRRHSFGFMWNLIKDTVLMIDASEKREEEIIIVT